MQPLSARDGRWLASRVPVAGVPGSSNTERQVSGPVIALHCCSAATQLRRNLESRSPHQLSDRLQHKIPVAASRSASDSPARTVAAVAMLLKASSTTLRLLGQ